MKWITLRLSTTWLRETPIMPGRCSWHGESAVGTASLPLPTTRSSVDREVSRSVEWPLCGQCFAFRRSLGRTASVLFLIGFVEFAVSAPLEFFTHGSLHSALLAVSIIGLLFMYFSTLPLSLRGIANIAGTSVSPDGTELRVQPVHPRFAREINQLRGASNEEPPRR